MNGQTAAPLPTSGGKPVAPDSTQGASMFARARARLTDLGWRKKILWFSGCFVVFALAVCAVGVVTVFYVNQSTRAAVDVARLRLDSATTARLAVLELDRAQYRLISAQSAEEIRQAAIASIRAASTLDEALQKLEQALPGNEAAHELTKVNEALKAPRMEIVQAAKQNDDATALAKTRESAQQISRIESLSVSILAKEQAALQERLGEVETQGKRILMLLTTIVLIGSALALALSWIAAGLLTRPLARLRDGITALARGDLRMQFVAHGKDEIGQTVTSLADTVGNLHGMVSSIQTNSVTLNTQAGQLSGIAQDLAQIETHLAGVVGQIRENSSDVLTATEESVTALGMAVSDVRTAAEKAGANAQSILKIAEEFKRFKDQVDDSIRMIKELSTSVASITAITGTIRDISSQTNLLALNAAIEAARAGEQGRGFAVVADEVRRLAERTQAATVDITGLAETVSRKVEQTTSFLDGFTQTAEANAAQLQEVANTALGATTDSEQTCNVVDSVTQRMREQREAVNRIAAEIKEMAGISEKSHVQAESLRGMAAELNVSASGLNQLVARFQL